MQFQRLRVRDLEAGTVSLLQYQLRVKRLGSCTLTAGLSVSSVDAAVGYSALPASLFVRFF